MKNYYKILREAKAECAACGIWLGEVADIGICHKNLKRWGRCRYIADEDCYYIEISYRLVDDAASDKALKETILHELCHTVDGCMNHQKKWKETVAKLNERYGYNIKTADTAADKGLESIEPEKLLSMSLSALVVGKSFRDQEQANSQKTIEHTHAAYVAGSSFRLFRSRAR